VASGVAYSQTITASGSTAPYTFAVTAGSLPAGLSLSAAGVLSGSSTATGSYTFTVTATDSSTSHFNAAKSYTVGVNPVAPVANAVSASVAYNSAANAIGLNITGGAATSVAVASAASHGTATASGTNITYTPATGYSGTDSFTYTATNGGGTSAAATVSITVAQQLPVAGAVSVSVLINSKNNVIGLNLTGGGATSVTVTGAASHGTATASGAKISYTPATDYTGADSFTYTATNGGGTSAAATVSITVQARTDPAKETTVTGLLTAQVGTSQLFAKTQISNFQSHLENLHGMSTLGGGGQKPSLAEESSPQGVRKRFPSQQSSLSAIPSSAATSVAASPATNLAANSLAGNGVVGNGVISAAASGTANGSENRTFLEWSVESLLTKLATTIKNRSSRSSLMPSTVSLDDTYKDPLGIGVGVWTAGSLSVGRSTDGDSRFSTSGLSAGSDLLISDTLSIGLGVGYGRQHQTADNGGTVSDGSSYGVMLYGNYWPMKGVFVDGLLGYNHLNFDLQRYVSGAGSSATSQRTGAQWLASVSSGYEFRTNRWLLSPYGRLDLVSTQLDRSTENGAGSYNLVYFKQSTLATKGSLGLRSSLLFEFQNVTAKPYARFEFQHDLSNSGVATIAYADQVSTGAAYQYTLGGAGQNNMVLGGGADIIFYQSWQLGLEYRFNHSSTTEIQTFNALLRKTFAF
jgi:outer membrane autotransporter protein